jgi:hypothetical protein
MEDRETVGLTPETAEILAEVEEHAWFADAQDIGRFCLAYAVKRNVPDGATLGTTTKWAAGNFDKTGEIKAVLAALYPDCTTPVRLMEHLVNEGLRMIGQRVRSDRATPADLMD